VNMADMCDPRRTVNAALIGSQSHTVKEVSNGHFVTNCGEQVRRLDLLIFRQRPEDIKCPECREGK
jgi:hypothetical protein